LCQFLLEPESFDGEIERLINMNRGKWFDNLHGGLIAAATAAATSLRLPSTRKKIVFRKLEIISLLNYGYFRLGGNSVLTPVDNAHTHTLTHHTLIRIAKVYVFFTYLCRFVVRMRMIDMGM